MKTEIDRQYHSGFLISEQDLRRIVQSAQEHAGKLGALPLTKFVVKLKDGSLVESESLDNLLTMENGGQKAVTRIELRWASAELLPTSSIRLQFEDAGVNPKSWVSTSYSVIGESRDAAFVAAADLEERVKKTRTTSWPYLLTRPWFVYIPLMLGLILSFAIGERFSSGTAAADQLEQAYKAGRIANPIEAIILLERLKATKPFWQSVTTSLVPFFTPYVIFAVLLLLVPKMAYPYVFYWGDAVARHDQRRGRLRVFWTVVVLGIFASVVGGMILRAFHW